MTEPAPCSVVVRAPKVGEFSQIENSTLRDDRLSFRATGLLAYLLSLPPGAKVDARRLAKVKTEGRDAIRTASAELRDAGYLHSQIVRDQSGSGRFRTVTYVLEVADPDWTPPPGSDSQAPADTDTTATGVGFPGPGSDSQAPVTGVGFSGPGPGKPAAGKPGHQERLLLKNPPTSSSESRPPAGPVDNDEDQERDLGAVWDAMAERAERDHRGQVHDPAAFRRSVAAKAGAEHTERARRLIRDYPTLTDRDLAAVLAGERGVLAHHERRICPACDDQGVIEVDEGIFAKCPDCSTTEAAA